MGQIITVDFRKRRVMTGRDDRQGPGLQPRTKPGDFLISPELRRLIARQRADRRN